MSTKAVGKSFQTRLQEGSDRVGQILQARPELFPLMREIAQFGNEQVTRERLFKLEKRVDAFWSDFERYFQREAKASRDVLRAGLWGRLRWLFIGR